VAAQELLADVRGVRRGVAAGSGNPAVAEVDDSDLRLCLQRAAQAVGQDVPEVGLLLGRHLLRTCGLFSADERAARYTELGGLLIALGQAYLDAAPDITGPPGPARR
jgi:hypothetical protein